MLKIPDKSEFPLGKENSGSHWQAGYLKNPRLHIVSPIGQQADAYDAQGVRRVQILLEAWQRRVLSGQASEVMMRNLDDVDPKRALELFADWTDRIAAGELPKSKPSRPQGVERNVVITCGIGRHPRPTCTTRSPPTSAIPQLTPTA